MSVYADTSFFVSLYLPNEHSAEASRRMAAGPRVWLTPLHRAEWVHAVEQHVFRKEIPRSEAAAVSAEFDQDCAEGVWVQAYFPDDAFAMCTDLARRYAARMGTRMLDSLHVAAALALKAEQFWTFDERQAKLAQAAGLPK
ncbi:MAG TPA: type II toxin-antitoxin system VapC family toxin [Candidatus Acidoferrales bacterium]|nr:type II toxin-antitoxin system VapC family toxin [Candidatus Acidoferrales bacterium]